ncbi:MAG: hypothetical protein K6F92_07785 [Lachnospiraceae bacterium]|nr:hypothetical protein [Lachnospiraceae bacterium]
MIIEKGHRGYLNRKKIIYSCLIIVFMAVIVFFFYMSTIRTGMRSNIYKVMGVLTVLPMANVLTILIACIPFKEPDAAQFEEVKNIIGAGVFSTECVVTSSNLKSIYLKYVYVCDKGVIALADNDHGKNEEYVKYIEGMLASNFIQMKVKIFVDYKAFIKRIGDIPVENRDDVDSSYLKTEGVIRNISI